MDRERYQHEKMYRDAGWQSLANAIVEMAAKDLMNVYKMNKKKCNRETIVKNHPNYRFFYSEWFCMLTSIDGDAITRAIRRREWED